MHGHDLAPATRAGPVATQNQIQR